MTLGMAIAAAALVMWVVFQWAERVEDRKNRPDPRDVRREIEAERRAARNEKRPPDPNP